MVIDNEVWYGNSLIHHTENYYPFPSKTFALLFFHLHSRRPMVYLSIVQSSWLRKCVSGGLVRYSTITDRVVYSRRRGRGTS